MSVLDGLLSVLKTEYKPGPGAYLQIDEKKLAEKLHLRDRGAENGSQDHPPSSAEIFDEAEQDIINSIRSVAVEAASRTHDQLSTYAERLKAADASGSAAHMKVLARQSEGAFDAGVLSARGDLEKAHRELEERRAEMATFKAANKLVRPPWPPKDHVLMGAGLVVMFGIEVVPNAMILASGEELGYLGGISQALIYSFLNIGFGFTSGLFAWTNVIHRNPLRAFLGFAVSLAIFAFVCGLNLALAHYRVAAQTMPSAEAVQAAWRQLSTSPLAIADLKSASMVAMGVLFSFFSMLEGWFWRDPYPGYAAVASHLSDVETTFHNLIDAKISELTDIQDRYITEITTERRKLRDRRQETPLILEQRKRLIALFNTHLMHLNEVARYLLALYRDANRKARKTPPPAHFNASWELGDVDRFDVSDEIWNTPDEDWKEADRALEASVEKLQSSFETALKWIRELGRSKEFASGGSSDKSLEN